MPSGPLPPENGKRALITGISGQDGSYLAEFLLQKGYHVTGTLRPGSPNPPERIRALFAQPESAARVELIVGDLLDRDFFDQTFRSCGFDEVYNLAAQTQFREAIEHPEQTFEVCSLAVAHILECLRQDCPKVRYFQASSSAIFGNLDGDAPDEDSPIYPRNPYGAAKCAAHFMTSSYRDTYGLFAVNGILFSHESPRRNPVFVSRKITQGAARIHAGIDDVLSLGNLDAQRDWGYAADHVRAMWMMLQAETPKDYVIATGDAHPVREFVERTFHHLGMPVHWEGSGVDEVAKTEEGRVVVRVDPRFFRPDDRGMFCGNAKRIREDLGWRPEVSFDELVRMMVEHDRDLMAASRQPSAVSKNRI